MTPENAMQYRARVEEFRRKHRTGLVTLLFTDIVGSTKLKQTLGDREGVAVIQHHHAVVREILSQFKEAEEISTAGDSFFMVFVKPSDAARFALLLQSRLRTLVATGQGTIQDRIGIHIGEVVIEEREGMPKPKDLYGTQVDICARVMSLATADQILLTRSAFDNARQVLKGEDIPGLGELSWLNHGPYVVAGVEEPLEVCELGEAGRGQQKPPADATKAHRMISAEEEPVLGWRPALGQAVPNTKWVLEQKLGEGGFGEVWLGRHQTMKERRVFKFCFRADRVRSLKREMTLFRLIKERIGDHPNIVSLREVYFDEPPYYVVMDHVEGSDLKNWAEAQGGLEKVPLETKLEIVAQIADALQAAHDAGVIHRDVKPGNILVATQRPEVGGQKPDFQHSTLNTQPSAKLTDFGIGQVVSQECLADVTKAGFTQTMLGSTSKGAGTTMYLAPEIIAGNPATAQSDIYSLGVVLHQLLVGDFKRPMTTDWIADIREVLLQEDVRRCVTGKPEERFGQAAELASSLRALSHRRAERETQETALAARAKAALRWQVLRAVGIGAVLFVLSLTVLWSLHRSAKVRWAHEVAVPEVARLAAAEKYAAAFALAREVQGYIPNDPVLGGLWSQIAVSVSIETKPPGAGVYLKLYETPAASWRLVGKSPLKAVELPRAFYRWQLRKDGYETVEQALTAATVPTTFVLDAVGSVPPEMVRVSGGGFVPQLPGLDHLEAVNLEDYFIDRFEVSNRRFKDFVDHGGYEQIRHWKYPFVKDGRPIGWEQAQLEFRDQTGRPGPAGWTNGSFLPGQEDFPVSGVSWYEAAAYAEFSGKRLPTLFHWNKAAGIGLGAQIIPLSNFSGQGPAPVGSHQGMSPSGAFDMAGNVKEWGQNEFTPGTRWVFGGAWDDPTYFFAETDAAPLMTRLPTLGFRCMKSVSPSGPPQATLGALIPVHRDYHSEKPVSEEIFRAYCALFSYDKTALEPKVESIDESSPLWRRERVTFNAAYGNERVIGILFIPKHRRRPYQAVICFPGAGALSSRSIETDLREDAWIKALVQSGRAVFHPVYRGTYERGIGLSPTSIKMKPTSAYRDLVIILAKDFRRSVDYLLTREDIDPDRLGYSGYSWGSRMATVLIALEDRVKVGVLIHGGFPMQNGPPEVDHLNFAHHVKVPVLMLNGRYDNVFPLEASQIPMFNSLGTPEKDKRHVILDIGHQMPSQDAFESEVVVWLDRYLGPVKEDLKDK
jgi:serine/threonine protein kinase/class 3 adenylate cyclase/formylglycine-generating enzyme required for sulfatase activity/cephalosporin-C deacetylase-like acetyl esterase